MMKSCVLSVASFAEVIEFRYCTSPIVARIMISAITTISSMSVQPPSLSRRRAWRMTSADMGTYLPVLVLRAVERRAFRLGVDVEHVLPAPHLAVRLILVRPLAPVGRIREGIEGNSAE